MRNWLEYIPFILIAKLVRALPRRTALAFGRDLGAAGRKLISRRVAIARENLAHALPELAEAEREKILTENFILLGLSFIEMLRLDKLTDEDLRERYSIQGTEHIDGALAHGRGAILLTGHLGFWEAGAHLLARAGYRPAFVAKPMRNPLVDRYFMKMRLATGSTYIDSRKGARRILKTLQENRVVGVLMDQHAGRKQGIAVPFFGRPAWTTPVITEMAMKYRIPVIPAFGWRGENDCHQIRVEPYIFLEGSGDEAVRENTALLNRFLEAAIRREPSQWFWVHRRWR